MNSPTPSPTERRINASPSLRPLTTATMARGTFLRDLEARRCLSPRIGETPETFNLPSRPAALAISSIGQSRNKSQGAGSTGQSLPLSGAFPRPSSRIGTMRAFIPCSMLNAPVISGSRLQPPRCGFKRPRSPTEG